MPGDPGRRRLGLDGQKAWITNAGVSEYYTVLAVTDPDGPRGRNITAFVVEQADPGLTFGAAESKLGIKGSPTRELLLRRRAGSPATGWSGTSATGCSSPCAASTTPG